MVRPSRDSMLMDIAVTVSKRSTCSRRQVGAVISRDGRILTMGYNGAPSGMDHCTHDPEEDTNDPRRAGCSISVHAEANAIAYAARYGMGIDNSTLFTTLSPCLACAQLIVNSGIERVVCLELYRDIVGVHLLEVAGLEVDVVSL